METADSSDPAVAACMGLLARSAERRATEMRHLLSLDMAVRRNLDPAGHHIPGRVEAQAVAIAERTMHRDCGPSLVEQWVTLVGDLRLLEHASVVLCAELRSADDAAAMLEHLALLGRLARRRDDYLARLNRFQAHARGHMGDRLRAEVRGAYTRLKRGEGRAREQRAELEDMLCPSERVVAA